MRRAFCLVMAWGLLGCEEEPPQFGGAVGGNVDRRAAAAEPEKAASDVPPPVELQETEFMETDRSRDPFRSFAKAFVNEARGEVRSQREVVLDQYSIDELQLVGIITGIHPEKAMLVDPTGVGHVVSRGQFVGRATVVQPTGGTGAAYELNWRVDRIRDGDLVLVRDDPSNPEIPSSTRVLQLRAEDVNATDIDEPAEDPQAEFARIKERILAMEAEAQAKKNREAAGRTD